MAYKDYSTPKASAFMKFLWRIAGAEKYILMRGTFSDQVKWACLGGIVLSTGIMAAFAGGYAFYNIFQPRTLATTDDTHVPTVLLSLVFGLLWGLIILNIDRFIVSATGKGDGTEAITWDELRGAIPRIIMGSIIAITISKPIEIRMFKTEIDLALAQHQEQVHKELLEGVEGLYEERIQVEKDKLAKWEAEISTKEKRAADLEDQYIEEARNITVGPRARAVKAQWDRAKAEAEQLKAKYEPLMQESLNKIGSYEQEKLGKMADAETKAAKLDGLLERIKLAHEVAGWPITIFITLLFLAIELTPIFFKMMLVRGPYDYLEENLKEIVKARQGVQVLPDFYTDRKGKERDKVVYHFAERIIKEKEAMLKAQQELSEHALDKWKAKEKERINEDPDAYIRTGPEA
ncbi:MAG: DUF4407 domain-containing protein [Flavobacteriales bacterium]|nr:DUF4407 domain-containing protein [Flavobacteriales bacterium]MCB0782344.1 DUF4407 domain-containing protein [Flavobacteriales bacterium]MCB0784813.1 DUF4407 domain-containing protein [Flavobacteriales bacterium]MCB9179325.1 DUF4407 domain-containing protein [Flavobacteriales bacterium]